VNKGKRRFSLASFFSLSAFDLHCRPLKNSNRRNHVRKRYVGTGHRQMMLQSDGEVVSGSTARRLAGRRSLFVAVVAGSTNINLILMKCLF
jgi:hypothetical protein